MKKNPAIQIAVVGLAAIALFILPQVWGWAGFPVMIIFGMVIITVILVRWHARNTGYRCPACDFTFTISPWTDFLSPHKSGVKMLRCPQCLGSSWCPEIDRTSVTVDSPANETARIAPAYSPAPLYLQIGAVVSLYIALWIVTQYYRTILPTEIPLLAAMKIPFAIAVLVVMHCIFCLYAARHGYRSRIYILITIFVAAFLLLAIWIQHRQLSQMT